MRTIKIKVTNEQYKALQLGLKHKTRIPWQDEEISLDVIGRYTDWMYHHIIERITLIMRKNPSEYEERFGAVVRNGKINEKFMEEIQQELKSDEVREFVELYNFYHKKTKIKLP
jgi:hypothetical protein